MRVLAITLVLLAACCGAASTEVLEFHRYEPTDLPSHLGWRFNPEGDEELTCWLQDGALHIDTMGQPDYTGPGVAYYHRPFRVLEGDPETITVAMRARVTEIEASGDWRTSFALVVDWTWPDGTGDHFGFAIAPAHLFRWYNGHSFADLDATQWHDYTMICDLVHGLMTVQVDGETIGTYEVDPAQGYRRVYVGDLMLDANAHGEVAWLEYTVEGSPGVAVLPATLSAIRHLFAD